MPFFWMDRAPAFGNDNHFDGIAVDLFPYLEYYEPVATFGYIDDINVVYINPEQLLFIKAYALGALDARELTPIGQDDEVFYNYAEASPIQKEIELLLFEM